MKKLKERQFDEATLHQLFRVFDRDNMHALSLGDFQTGLIAMGYDEARDISVVSRIMSEIDQDKSANISEDEFVAYFSKRRLEDLAQRLHEVAKEGTSTTVQVIEYTHTHIHTYTHTYIHTYIHAYVHTHIFAFI